MTSDLFSKVEQLQQEARRLHREVAQLRMDLGQRPLLAAGHFRGVDSVKITQFQRRLFEEDVEEKGHLSDYLLRASGSASDPRLPSAAPLSPQPGLSLFCESGSTFSPLIRDLAIEFERLQPERVKGKRNGYPMRTRTNNMLALTAWTNLAKEVVVEPGTFIDDYYGFFPFSNNEDDVNWEREAESFEIIKRDVSECDRVLATCSHFSFLAGPLVASRANAVFKHAMHAGIAERQIFQHLFAWQKVVLLSSPAVAGDEKWCTVFGRPAWLAGGRIAAAANDSWHSRWFRGSIRSTGQQFRDGVEQNVKPLPKRWQRAEFDKTWIEVAPKVTVIIGLGTTKATERYEALAKEIEACQKLLDDAVQCTIQISSKVLALQTGVAVVRYT